MENDPPTTENIEKSKRLFQIGSGDKAVYSVLCYPLKHDIRKPQLLLSKKHYMI